MPFDFLRRKGAEPAKDAESGADAGRGIEFDGLTEEWRLTGTMEVAGRLSDALNQREPIAVRNIRWAPVDGSAPPEDAPGLRSVDPYDLIIVLAGGGSLPPLTDDERNAHRVHKVSYDVALDVPPYRVIGTIYLYPGHEPERLLERSTEMFVPVVGATATLGERQLGDDMLPVVLVNRFYLKGVTQVDRRTGEPPARLPGSPLGGTSWQDRSR
ncbi:MAG: hypothetical protein ACJ761_08580 [Chloroflexota bacterium]